MIRHLFTSEYLLAPSLNGLHSKSDILYTLIALGLVIGVIVLTYAMRKNKKNLLKKEWFMKVRRLTITIGILAILWVFLRYEGIAILSAHWIIWAIYLIGIIWGLSLLKYKKLEYAPKIEAYEKEQQMKKYM